MSSEKNQNSIHIFFVFATLLVSMILFGIFDLGRQFRNHVVSLEETKNQPAAIETGKQTAEMTSGRIVNVDIKHGSNLYFACGSCHGDQAQGNKTLNAPALNVQEDWYMVRQLKKFKDGIRGTNPKDVPGMQMRPMALTLKDEQAMIDLAGHIATFKTKDIRPPERTLSGDVNKGRSLYTPCTACHGDQGQGNKTLHAPALAGQHDWYLIMQLKNFKVGIRGADPRDTSGALMRPTMITLPNEQAMKNVVAFISTFPISFGEVKPVAVGRKENSAIETPHAQIQDKGVASSDASGQPSEVTQRVATQSEILEGGDLFQGKIRFFNKGPSCISCHNVQNDAIIGGGILAAELTSVFTKMGGEGVRAILTYAPFPVMQQAYKNKPLTDDEIFALISFLEKVDEDQLFHHPRDYGIALFINGFVGAIVLLGVYSFIWRRRKKDSVNKDVFDRQIKSE